MPLYTYQCVSGHQTDLMRPIAEHGIPTRCQCGKVATQIIVGAISHVFGEQTFDDIGPHPITVRSKKELERACRKHGVFARNYMENYSPKERLIKYGA